ncbi:WXG100 family type VII secretion target, partial [Streptomyces sp. NPDC048278]|uniref:WXG100 family type VII secretion target n=1 Tax=Streptomyces sp. NPDC048278 TaxID=3155809 RepID=UPI00343DBF4E
MSTDSGNSSGSSGGGSGDPAGEYGDWDWKQVMKAVTGQDPDNPDQSQPSNPQSLQDAANTFWYVEQVLQEVGQSVSDQTEALAGQYGPWQGPAAQAFTSAMQQLSKDVTGMTNALSGGSTGDLNVPQQLANNAQHLREAMAKLQDIDNWYARQALEVDPSAQMDDGRVMVSKIKQIPTMMGNDMRQVLITLAQHYKLTQDNVQLPNQPANPTQQGQSQGAADAGYASAVQDPGVAYGSASVAGQQQGQSVGAADAGYASAVQDPGVAYGSASVAGQQQGQSVGA